MSSTESAVVTNSASFHFCRVTRQENRFMGEHIVSSEELHRLAMENRGLFAGGFETIGKMESMLATLARFESAQRWIVAVASKEWLFQTETQLRERNDLTLSKSRSGTTFRADHLKFTTLEALPHNAPQDLDGVILYDPLCIVHRARSFRRNDGSNHDRPQILADFLARRSAANRGLLLCLMTLKPPLASNTVRIGEIYMRDGWIFADPFSLSFVEDQRGCSTDGWN